MWLDELSGRFFTHPLMQSVAGMSYVEARWRCEYDLAIIDGSFGNKNYHIEMKIIGDKIIEPRGKPAVRLR